MLRVILAVGVCLLGTLTGFNAVAFDLNRPESLNYSVYWGPLKAGKATLDYAVAAGGGYSVTVRAKDGIVLLDFDDVWKVNGVHTAARAFVPEVYQAQQHENDYRADKVVTFNADARTISYTNRRDAHDKEPVLAWKDGMRDALSAVYAWRLGGVAEVKRGGTLEVMGLKRPFTLTKQAGVREMVVRGGKNMAVWRVDMTTAVNGKPSKDRWIVRLRDDATLVPVEIVAVNKFGSFKAVLQD